MNKLKIDYEILTNNIFKGENDKYYYFYKIINLTNNKYYYGVHETKNIDDNYSGSGSKLVKEQLNIGIDKFKKYILKFFNNHQELYDYEKKIVNKKIAQDKNCYNCHTGGDGSWDFTLGKVCVKDKNNNMFLVDIDDERYLSGELVSNMKGLIHVKDLNGNKLTISIEEYRNNKDKYLFVFKNTVSIIDENGVKKHISKKEFDLLKSKGLINGITKGKGVFKDKKNNTFMCDINDPKVISREFVGATKEYTIYKYKSDFSKTCFTSKNDPRVLSGELVGINYGIVYCRNIKTGEKVKIYRNDERLKNGELVTAKTYNELKRKGLI